MISLLVCVAAIVGAAPIEHGYTIEVVPSIVGPADYFYMQTRAAFIPGEEPRVLMLTQEIEKSGAHGFRDVFQTETRDGGKTWSEPRRIEGLNRAKRPDGYEVVIGDLMPQW